MPQPIALSEEQMAAILADAQPLERHAREPFLREVAQMLQAQPQLGDGSLHRLIMEVQRRHRDPPNLS
jgi:hypothetical protein